jgi:hypothetical protein
MAHPHGPDPLAPMVWPPVRRPPFVPVLRPGPGGAVEVVILSDLPQPTGIHYFPAHTLRETPQTLGHTSPTCRCYGCVVGRPVRLKAYLLGLLEGPGRQCLVELTEHAALDLAQAGKLRKCSLRGYTLRLIRHGRKAQGVVHAAILPVGRVDPISLPVAFPLRPCLDRIWGETPSLPS